MLESHLHVCVGDSLEDCGVMRGDNVTGEIGNVVASTSLTENWSPADREGSFSEAEKDRGLAWFGKVCSKKKTLCQDTPKA